MSCRTGILLKAMNTKSRFVSILSPVSFATALVAFSVGCAHYVHPAKPNTAEDLVAYTRAESLTAEQRLVDAILVDPTFGQHYDAKKSQKGGAVPVVQVAHIDNLSTVRHGTLLAAIRRNLETALRSSGCFVLSGDPAACDYILRGEFRDIIDVPPASGWRLLALLHLVDDRRVTHQLALRLHDIASDLDVWTGTDEIAKEEW